MGREFYPDPDEIDAAELDALIDRVDTDRKEW